VTWNHPTEVDFPFIDTSCHHDNYCGDVLIEGHGHFHTDFLWCNFSTDTQEMDLYNNNYSVNDGTYWTDFTQVAPCQGLHHATRVWVDSNPSVDEE